MPWIPVRDLRLENEHPSAKGPPLLASFLHLVCLFSLLFESGNLALLRLSLSTPEERLPAPSRSFLLLRLLPSTSASSSRHADLCSEEDSGGHLTLLSSQQSGVGSATHVVRGSE